jgi:type II secretory pathway component PulJ
MMKGRRDGFTLIEVVGAFFIMIVILIFVTGIFVENGRQRSVATELMRVHTASAATLDLIAQDLEGAVFVAPIESAPQSDHPWVFLADRAGPSGATYLRFPTQNIPPERLGEHSASWVEVIYFLTEDEPERFTLWRWRSTRPPSNSTQASPDTDDPGSARVIEGVADFGVIFVGANGGNADDWDSAVAPREQPIPIGAEIRLSLFREAREGEGNALEIPSSTKVRHVSLPMHRPIDVERLALLAQEGEEEPGCATIDRCRELGGNDDWFFDARDDCDGEDSDLCDALNTPGTTCWDDLVQISTSLANRAPEQCDAL